MGVLAAGEWGAVIVASAGCSCSYNVSDRDLRDGGFGAVVGERGMEVADARLRGMYSWLTGQQQQPLLCLLCFHGDVRTDS